MPYKLSKLTNERGCVNEAKTSIHAAEGYFFTFGTKAGKMAQKIVQVLSTSLDTGQEWADHIYITSDPIQDRMGR